MSVVYCIGTKDAMGELGHPLQWKNDTGGGTKSFFMNIVKELPKHGHGVHVFSTFSQYVDDCGVQYHPIEEISNFQTPHVLWACYDLRPLKGCAGSVRIGSHHSYRTDVPWNSIDIHTAPSQYTVDFLKRTYAPWADWHVQPNAVEPDLDSVQHRPVPGRIIYHTSWDRGLLRLCKVWPEIVTRAPGASLHVICQLPDRQRMDDPGEENCWEARHFRDFWQAWDNAISVGGVTHMQNVPRSRVLEELSQASVMAYPCQSSVPCEAGPVSVMECCKLGIPVVLTPQDALESIFKGGAIIARDLTEFTDKVVQVLSDHVVAKRYGERGQRLVSPYTYENAGRVLSDIIRRNTGQ
jgi:glycosyltransferase involved in cell wall biosynthesis